MHYKWISTTTGLPWTAAAGSGSDSPELVRFFIDFWMKCTLTYGGKRSNPPTNPSRLECKSIVWLFTFFFCYQFQSEQARTSSFWCPVDSHKKCVVENWLNDGMIFMLTEFNELFLFFENMFLLLRSSQDVFLCFFSKWCTTMKVEKKNTSSMVINWLVLW